MMLFGIVTACLVSATCAEAVAVASFETSADGYTFSKDAAVNATGDLQSRGAAPSGISYALIVVNGGGKAVDDAALISPFYELNAGSEYSYTFWAKAEPPAMIQVVIKNEQQAVVASNDIQVEVEWQRYMLSGFSPQDDGRYYWSIRVGATVAQYSFDEIALTAAPQERGPTAPIPTVAPATPAPLVIPTAGSWFEPTGAPQAPATAATQVAMSAGPQGAPAIAPATEVFTATPLAPTVGFGLAPATEAPVATPLGPAVNFAPLTSGRTDGGDASLNMAPITGGTPSTQKPIVATDFENDSNGWTAYVDATADAVSNLRYANASHSGSHGAAFQVNVPALENWHVQLKSPRYALRSDAAYTLTLWAVASVPLDIQVDLLTVTGGAWVTGSQFVLSNTWQQYMLPARATTTGAHQFTINMGQARGIFYIDDIVLMGIMNDGTPIDNSTIMAGTASSGIASEGVGLSGPGTSSGSTAISRPGGNAGGSNAIGTADLPGSKFLSADFESDASGFTVWVYKGDARASSTASISADLPEASYSLKSSEAAREGQYGVAVNVTETGSNDWYVQLKSAPVYYRAGNTYTYTFWGKVQSGQAQVQADLLTTVDFDWQLGSPIVLTTTWQRFQVGPFSPQADGTYVYTVNVGGAANMYLFDDAVVYQSGEVIGDLELPDLMPEGGVSIVSDFLPGSKDSSNGTVVNIDTGDYNFTEAFWNNRAGALTLNITGPDGRPVGQLAGLSLEHTTHEFIFGAALNHQVPVGKAEWYYNTVKALFNGVQPENAFKWPDYEPFKGDYQSGQDYVDNRYVNWARNNSMREVRLHTLEWLHQGYGFDKHWSRQEGCDAYKTYLEGRIRRDVTHFAGRTDHYDVWNEVLHESYLLDECNLWNTTFVEAWTWAHEEDPEAKLCINDYEVIDHANKTQQYYDIIKGLLDAGAPIHCIGVQAHLDLSKPGLSPEKTKSKLDMLAKLGLPIVVTEFSLRSTDLPAGSTAKPSLDLDETQQAEEMLKYLAVMATHWKVTGVYWWGFWDSMHWISNGGMYYEDGRPKLAALALQELMRSTWGYRFSGRDVKLDDGAFEWKGPFGEYKYDIEWRGNRYQGYVDFQKNGKAPVSLTIKLDIANRT